MRSSHRAKMLGVALQHADTPLNIAVLVSGTGTLLQAIIDGQGDHYRVVHVFADTACPAVDRAQRAGIPATVVPLERGGDRDAWNKELTHQVHECAPDVVVSAGFMRILGEEFVRTFTGRAINTHPALLPAFPGAHAVRDALAYGVKVTGSTVHYIDAGVDTGQIIAQRPVPVHAGESEAEVHERIKVEERELIVEVLRHADLSTGGKVTFAYDGQ